MDKNENKEKLNFDTRNKIHKWFPSIVFIGLIAYPFLIGIFIPEFVDFLNSSSKIVWSRNLIIAFVLLIPWLIGLVWAVYCFRNGNSKIDILTSSLIVVFALVFLILINWLTTNNEKETPTSEDMFYIYTKDDFLIDYNLENADENYKNKAWYYFSEGMEEGKIVTETLYEDRKSRK